jgi:peptide/nickel transport system permease protein
VGRRRGLTAPPGLPVLIALGAFGLVTLIAIVGPGLTPHDPLQPAGAPLQPPGHGGLLLGSDEIGLDVFSRVLVGIRASWLGVLAVIASGVLVGGAVGLVAGLARGWVDGALMRATDAALALPAPLLAIAVVAALGAGYVNTLLALALVWWPPYARIVRGQVRAVAVRPHVEAARLSGVGRFRLALRHVLPGTYPALACAATLDVGNLLLTLAALSFLGLGARAPAPELGAMSARGLDYLLQDWWVATVPALALLGLAMVANLAGDALVDRLGAR